MHTHRLFGATILGLWLAISASAREPFTLEGDDDSDASQIEQARYEDAKLGLAQSKTEVLTRREALIRAMGVRDASLEELSHGHVHGEGGHHH